MFELAMIMLTLHLTGFGLAVPCALAAVDETRSGPGNTKPYSDWSSSRLVTALPVTNDPALFAEVLTRYTVPNPAVRDATLPMRRPDVPDDEWQFLVTQCGKAIRELQGEELRLSILHFIDDAVTDTQPIQDDLVACLDNPEERVRDMAIQVMIPMRGCGEVGRAYFVGPLTGALKNPSAATRSRAAFAIGHFGEVGAQAVPKLIEAIRDSNQGVRFGAAQSLGMIGASAGSSAPALIAALDDSYEPVRYSAAESLGRIGADPDDTVPKLVQSLEDESRMVRGHAATAIGRFGPKAAPAIDALIERLRDAEPNVRWSAADGLGGIGPAAASAVPALIEATKDEVPHVRYVAVGALGKIGGSPDLVVPVLQAELANEEWLHRCGAIDALGNAYLETSAALDAVLGGLMDSEPIVVVHSIKILERMGPRGFVAIAQLRTLAERQGGSVRAAAQRALEKLESERSAQIDQALQQSKQDGN